LRAIFAAFRAITSIHIHRGHRVRGVVIKNTFS
jgi:hypothetical protein